MAVGAERYALLFRFFNCLGYVPLSYSQIIDRSLTFLDHMMKVNDRRVFFPAMTTSLPRLVCDPLCSVFISALPRFLNNFLSISFVPLTCVQLLLGLTYGLVFEWHRTPYNLLRQYNALANEYKTAGVYNLNPQEIKLLADGILSVVSVTAHLYPCRFAHWTLSRIICR